MGDTLVMVLLGGVPSRRYAVSMPSDLPKVTAYVSREACDVLDAASEALGQSRSRLVSDLLNSALPVLRAVTDAALVVKNANQMQRQALQGAAGDIAAFTSQARGLEGQVIDLLGRVSGEPPTSNTGVRK